MKLIGFNYFNEVIPDYKERIYVNVYYNDIIIKSGQVSDATVIAENTKKYLYYSLVYQESKDSRVLSRKRFEKRTGITTEPNMARFELKNESQFKFASYMIGIIVLTRGW